MKENCSKRNKNMDGLNNLSKNGSRRLSKWRRIKSNSSKRKSQLQKLMLLNKIHSKEIPQPYLRAKLLKLIQSQRRKSKKNPSVTMSLSCLENQSSNTWIPKKKNPISKADLDYSDNLKIHLLFKPFQDKSPNNCLNWDLTLRTLWRHLFKLLLNKNIKTIMIVKCQTRFSKIMKVLIQTISLNLIKNLSMKENSLPNNGLRKWRTKYLREQLRRKMQRQDSSLKSNNNKRDDR